MFERWEEETGREGEKRTAREVEKPGWDRVTEPTKMRV